MSANLPTKEGQGGNNRRTKAQLQKALKQAHEALDDREAEIAALQQELAQAQATIKTLNRQLQELQETLQERSSTIEAEQTSTGASEEGVEQRIAELERENEELRSALSQFKETEAPLQEAVPAAKATFRIDLYPRQGNYQGKIEHLQSKDRKVFSGVNREAIFDFVSGHLPALENDPEDYSSSRDASTPVAVAVAPPYTKPQFAGLPRICDFQIVPLDQGKPVSVLRREQPFHVHLTLDLTEIEAERSLLFDYRISLYAKNLETGQSMVIGQMQDRVPSSNQYQIDAQFPGLQVGSYRIEAMVNFSLLNGEPTPVAAFQESNLIHVY